MIIGQDAKWYASYNYNQEKEKNKIKFFPVDTHSQNPLFHYKAKASLGTQYSIIPMVSQAN